MAGASNNQQFNPGFLSQNQQDLLMAALASNQPDKAGQLYAGEPLTNGANFDYQMGTLDPSMFLSANQSVGNYDLNGLDDQQFLDMMQANGNSIDFDALDDAGGLMDDTADPSAIENGDMDIHDKRKSPEDGDSEDADPKRREGDDKAAKKPGRKPLTTEPTTKRKAQNRAAQRAFRERKEKHLKDLETKVQELEKASDSANHENGLLRAQVSRLQMELREYRKRLSLQSTLGRSPPLGGLQSSMFTGNSTTDAANAFQFAFPKFGSLPSLPMNGQTPSSTTSPPALSTGRHTSTDSHSSPKSLARGSISSTDSPGKMGSISESANGASPAFSTMFGTPSSDGGNDVKPYNIFAGGNGDAQTANQTSSESTASNSRLFQFNPNSSSSNSPSVSSISQYGNGASSSAGTSPEPAHNSPAAGNKDSQLDTINENGYACHTTSDGEVSFCEKLNMACGNIRDPTPRLQSISNSSPATATTNAEPTKAVGGIDYFATQNGGQFDPVLFGDYRESNAAIVGDGDFTGGFFNDAMPSSMDWNSPVFNWNDLTGSSLQTGLTPAVQKNNPLEQADALVSGMDDEDLVVPGEDTTKMLSCHKIWGKLQEHQDFKDGTFDIDGLCSELRAKARCSESGVVIDQKDVDAALLRMPNSRQNSDSNIQEKA